MQRDDRLAHGRRGDVQHAAPAALAHARHHALDQRHRREHERAVRGLPLLARERERLAERRPAGVADEDVDRAELALDRVDERPRRRRRRSCPRRSARCCASWRATRAPSASSSAAIAAPIPFEAPVTSATLPVSPRSTPAQITLRPVHAEITALVVGSEQLEVTVDATGEELVARLRDGGEEVRVPLSRGAPRCRSRS